MRYTGPVRFIGVTPDNEATVVRFGRNLIGDVMEQVRLGGLFQYQMQRTYDDIVLTARFDGTIAMLFATTRGGQSAQTLNTASRIWLPHGFVVYPSSSGSSTGWGTPVIQTITATQFDKPNTAPGLDVARWTTNGKLGEVFLSRQVDAGYPKQSYGITPAFYSATESPLLVIDAAGNVVGRGGTYKPPALGAWNAYRVEFDNFGTDTTTATQRQSLFATLRLATEYLLPVRGSYDLATRASTYVVSDDFGGAFWISDATLRAATIGYDTFARRAAKDGIVALAHETIAAISDEATLISVIDINTHLNDATFVEARTSLDVGIAKGITVVSALQRDQWIAYGVRQWIGDDPALPVVSWDGFPSWNWPYYLVLGTTNSGAWVDLDFYTIRVRGVDQKLFSKRVCANGRVLGTLPDYVLSAGVQTRVDGNATIDRLIVLGFRLSDQPPYVASGLGAFEPYVKTLRVYFVDILRRNNLVLLPDHAVTGLYDGTTNPDGWHEAGTFDLYPSGFVGAGSYHSITQTPQFNGDGTRAVWIAAAYDDGITFHTGAFAIEGLFNLIDDGATSVSKALVNLETRSEHGIVFSASGYCYGIDYLPASLTVRFFYSCNVDYNDELTDIVLRWSGMGRGTGAIASSDIKCNTAFLDSFAFSSAWTLDPVRGAMVGLSQKASGGLSVSWRQQYTINGAAAVSSDINDGTGFPTYQNDVSTFGNAAFVGMSVFAKTRDDYMAGFELAPNASFLHAFFDSTVGDIASLTQTPGTGLRLYPAGAV